MNGSIRESKSKEELDEFFEKISTPLKRPDTAPNQRANDGTLRTHWAHEDRAPPTTWGQLAAQVSGLVPRCSVHFSSRRFVHRS